MGTADQTDRSRSPWPVIVLLLLPVIYLASLGPFVWVVDHGGLPSDAAESIVTTVYSPVVYLDSNTDFFDEHPIGRAYAAYVNWFD